MCNGNTLTLRVHLSYSFFSTGVDAGAGVLTGAATGVGLSVCFAYWKRKHGNQILKGFTVD